MTTDNIIKIVEFRERYRAMRIGKKTDEFQKLYADLKIEMLMHNVTKEEVIIDDEVFKMIIATKPELKEIIDDVYYQVDLYLINNSNKVNK